MRLITAFFFFGLSSFYLYFFYKSFIKNIIYTFTRKIPFEHRVLLPNKLSQEKIRIIENHSNFYKRLTPKHKKSYEHRVAKFLKKHPFVGRENMVVTDDIKIAIATTAIKLTFGLDDFEFNSFDKILVYPSSYFSRINNENHVGEFNPKLKLLIFSWEHFQESLFDKRDNLNLGIHEFSHALVYEILYYSNNSISATDSNFIKIYKEIKLLFNEETQIESIKKIGYLREYAFENIMEFVAVCLEHYYETPEVFEEKLPMLFSKIEALINTNERFFIK